MFACVVKSPVCLLLSLVWVDSALQDPALHQLCRLISTDRVGKSQEIPDERRGNQALWIASSQLVAATDCRCGMILSVKINNRISWNRGRFSGPVFVKFSLNLSAIAYKWHNTQITWLHNKTTRSVIPKLWPRPFLARGFLQDGPPRSLVAHILSSPY